MVGEATVHGAKNGCARCQEWLRNGWKRGDHNGCAGTGMVVKWYGVGAMLRPFCVMDLIWKCLGCKESQPGTAAGSGKMLTHRRLAGPDHKAVLVDAETGEPVRTEDGREVASLRVAQSLGLVAREPKKPKIRGFGGGSGAVAATVKPERVEIDPGLLALYEWDRLIFPDAEFSFSEWLYDCVVGFHIQNADRLKLERLFLEQVENVAGA